MSFRPLIEALGPEGAQVVIRAIHRSLEVHLGHRPTTSDVMAVLYEVDPSGSLGEQFILYGTGDPEHQPKGVLTADDASTRLGDQPNG